MWHVSLCVHHHKPLLQPSPQTPTRTAIHKNPDRILSSKASVASAPPDLMPTLSSLPSIISTTNPVANTLGDRLPSTPQQYTSTPGLYHAASGPVELQSAPRSLSLGRRRGSRSGGGGGSAANGGAVLTHVPEGMMYSFLYFLCAGCAYVLCIEWCTYKVHSDGCIQYVQTCFVCMPQCMHKPHAQPHRCRHMQQPLMRIPSP